MARGESKRVWVNPLRPEEKAVIAATCERFIAEFLEPRFLPQIRPTQFNYAAVTLEEALRLMQTDELLYPL